MKLLLSFPLAISLIVCVMVVAEYYLGFLGGILSIPLCLGIALLVGAWATNQ